MKTFHATALGLAALLTAGVGSSTADTITVMSDATTLAAVQNDTTALNNGDTSGLTFAAATVGTGGSNVAAPPGSPAGTLAISIPPGSMSGFFESFFTLPSAFSSVTLSGAGNTDDEGRVFLNGHALTPALGQSGELTEFGNQTFSTSTSSFFVAGQNVLLIADSNSGGGPSGAAYYATINFTPSSAVPEPSTWALTLAGAAGLAALRRWRRAAV